jgi:glutathione-specific gamma-glutamylcyclotransferase
LGRERAVAALRSRVFFSLGRIEIQLDMSNLTRQQLVNGIQNTLGMPADLRWTEAQLEYSLTMTLAENPAPEIWIFAYGSLIWNPLIAFDTQHTGTLEGWHRSFCIRSISARGSDEHPGRVLALEPGGETRGVVYRIPPGDAQTELKLLWAREMGSGVYQPTWGTVLLDDGCKIRAILFVANPHQPLYANDASVATVARIAARATGKLGSNREYIVSLDIALKERQIEDGYITSILDAVSRDDSDQQEFPGA